MHPHLHMELARAIIDERLRDAKARHRNGQARQLGDRRPRRVAHTVTRGHSVSDRSRMIAGARVKETTTHTTKGHP